VWFWYSEIVAHFDGPFGAFGEGDVVADGAAEAASRNLVGPGRHSDCGHVWQNVQKSMLSFDPTANLRSSYTPLPAFAFGKESRLLVTSPPVFSRVRANSHGAFLSAPTAGNVPLVTYTPVTMLLP
jgi:hypothetical protein